VAAIYAGGRIELTDVALGGHRAGLQRFAQIVGAQLDENRLHLCHSDFGAPAAASAGHQGGDDGCNSDPRRGVIGVYGHVVTEPFGCVRVPPQGGQPDCRPHQRAVTHALAPRSAAAERTAFNHYDGGIQLAQGVVIESERLHRAGFEVCQQDVRLGDQAAHQFCATRIPQIQAQAQLVSVTY
jgi:hypothetical protein